MVILKIRSMTQSNERLKESLGSTIPSDRRINRNKSVNNNKKNGRKQIVDQTVHGHLPSFSSWLLNGALTK